MLGDTFANEHPESSKQSITFSLALLTWLCTGSWNNEWQKVMLYCTMQPGQALQSSNVDTFHCVSLVYVKREVNKQAERQWACNLVMRDHIRQHFEGMHLSEMKGALQVTQTLNTDSSYKVDTTTLRTRFCFKESVPVVKVYSVAAEFYTNQECLEARCLLNKSSLCKYLWALLDSLIKHVLLHDARTSP